MDGDFTCNSNVKCPPYADSHMSDSVQFVFQMLVILVQRLHHGLQLSTFVLQWIMLWLRCNSPHLKLFLQEPDHHIPSHTNTIPTQTNICQHKNTIIKNKHTHMHSLRSDICTIFTHTTHKTVTLFYNQRFTLKKDPPFISLQIPHGLLGNDEVFLEISCFSLWYHKNRNIINNVMIL